MNFESAHPRQPDGRFATKDVVEPDGGTAALGAESTPERAEVVARWGQANDAWVDDPAEVEYTLWETLREGRTAIGEEVPLPQDQPDYVDRDMHIIGAEVKVGPDFRPALVLELPHRYKTTAVATSDGVTWGGEWDRVYAEDRDAVEAWLTPHMVRVDAAADVLRRWAWFDQSEFERLTGSPDIYDGRSRS